MTRRMLAIDGILIVLSLVVTRKIQTHEAAPPVRPEVLLSGADRPKAKDDDEPAGRPPAVPDPMRIDLAFRPIIELPPPPPPPPPVPPPPPAIGYAFKNLDLIMMDPIRGTVLLRDRKTKRHIQWKVGQIRTVKALKDDLDVKLKKVDGREFYAVFTAPPNQQYILRLF